MPDHEFSRLYRAITHLYPRAYRQEYGDQMAQTFEDLLAEQTTTLGKAGIWVRVGRELPLTLLEEHIENIKGVHMKSVLANHKKLAAALGVIVIIIGGVTTYLALRPNEFAGTTLATVQRGKPLPACIGQQDDPDLKIDSKIQEQMVNTVIGSIIDVPAGTNVDVYFKTYDGKNATGTSQYHGKYGTYNFTMKHTDSTASNTFTGGWTVTHFETCS